MASKDGGFYGKDGIKRDCLGNPIDGAPAKGKDGKFKKAGEK